MGIRHRGEGENLAHCLVSGGGGWTQDVCTATQDRDVPPPVNSEPATELTVHSVHAIVYMYCSVV